MKYKHGDKVDQRKKYVPAVATDIRKTFERIRKEKVLQPL